MGCGIAFILGPGACRQRLLGSVATAVQRSASNVLSKIHCSKKSNDESQLHCSKLHHTLNHKSIAAKDMTYVWHRYDISP